MGFERNRKENGMKKFLHFVAELKSWGCLSFTGALCIYVAIDWICGGESMRYTLIVQMLAMCGVITLLQYVFFSGQVLKKPSYWLRLLVFCGLLFLVCSGFAWTFHWFPMGSAGAWLTFAGIFFAAFVILCLGFEVYFRALGKRYDEALGRQKRGPEDRG